MPSEIGKLGTCRIPIQDKTIHDEPNDLETVLFLLVLYAPKCLSGVFQLVEIDLHFNLLVEMIVGLMTIGQRSVLSNVREGIAKLRPHDTGRRIVPVLEVWMIWRVRYLLDRLSYQHREDLSRRCTHRSKVILMQNGRAGGQDVAYVFREQCLARAASPSETSAWASQGSG